MIRTTNIAKSFGDLQVLIVIEEHSAIGLQRAIQQNILAADFKGVNKFWFKSIRRAGEFEWVKRRIETTTFITPRERDIGHTVRGK